MYVSCSKSVIFIWKRVLGENIACSLYSYPEFADYMIMFLDIFRFYPGLYFFKLGVYLSSFSAVIIVTNSSMVNIYIYLLFK